MDLTVFDRLILLNVLPKEGDITTLRIVRALRDSLSFSEEEHTALQFKHDGNNIAWKEEADVAKDVVIGEKATDVIVSALRSLNKSKKLTEQHLGLYEKFIKTEE